MMHPGRLLTLTAVLVTALALPAEAKEKISVGYLDDINHRAVFYALEEGILKSDLIDLETRALPIPALLQATGGKDYDVVETAVIQPPRALARGLKLMILAVGLASKADSTRIYVRRDSGINSPTDLKGKTLAAQSLPATVTTYMRVVLKKKYGLNVDLKKGDIAFIEVPAPQLPTILLQRKADAIYAFHQPGWVAEKTPEFKPLTRVAAEFQEITGRLPVDAIFVATPDVIARKGAALKEFNRLLRASRQYLRDHQDEVLAAVAKKYRSDADFMKEWFAHQYDIPVNLDPVHLRGIETVWKETKEMGDIGEYPPLETFVWREGQP